MKRLVLDTCALIAFAGRCRMSGDVVLSIEAACRARTAFVPAVVALEIAQKWFVGKLRFSGAGTAREWHEQTMHAFRLRHLPISASVALAAYELPEPFTRIRRTGSWSRRDACSMPRS